MNRNKILLRAVTLPLLFLSFQAVAQSVDGPAYCPSTLTDADGDGWGIENNRPCRVLKSAIELPVCSITGAGIDTDRDGWGWLNEESCLVDNTSVENSFTIIDGNGNSTTEQVAPLLGAYVKPLGYFATEMQVDSNGIMYHHRIPVNAIAATNFDGTTLWEVKFYHDYVFGLILGNNEELLYVVTAEGHIEVYTVDGVFQWRSEEIGRILSLDLSQNAMILGVGEDDYSSERADRIISLNYDGTLRWEFNPVTQIGAYALGRDNRVYVKSQSNPYGNETTFILEE